MPELTTTSADVVRQVLIDKIKAVVPRAQQRRDQRWKWVGDRKRTRPTDNRQLRVFDVILSRPTPRPGFAYGGGVMFTAQAKIEVGYPLPHEEMELLAGADAQDLAALLVRLHAFVPGMSPCDMGPTRTELIVPTLVRDEANAYVVEHVIAPGISFFVSDQVTFAE